jgi:DNA-3-methyladenine glycosylase II
MGTIHVFDKYSYPIYCDTLRKQHSILQAIHQVHGYPPYWKRKNNFASLCKTILEQQVSLVSAQAVYTRLQQGTNMEIAILKEMSVLDYRQFGITRQKASYLQSLAKTVYQTPTYFTQLKKCNDIDAKEKLISLKGIGSWTANVYMLTALNRLNIYPDFDVALIHSIAHETKAADLNNNEEAKKYIAQFHPLRSIACCYFYHAYIQRKGISFMP